MTDTYSLTFIAHDSTLTSEQRQQIQDFVTSLKNLQILGKEELSKDRVIDFQVTTSTPDIVKNTIRSQIEQHDLAYDVYLQKTFERKKKSCLSLTWIQR